MAFPESLKVKGATLTRSAIWGAIQTIDSRRRENEASGVLPELDPEKLGTVPAVNNPINVNAVAKEKPKLAPEIGQTLWKSAAA